jgi:hypothetical protein
VEGEGVREPQGGLHVGSYARSIYAGQPREGAAGPTRLRLAYNRSSRPCPCKTARSEEPSVAPIFSACSCFGARGSLDQKNLMQRPFSPHVLAPALGARPQLRPTSIFDWIMSSATVSCRGHRLSLVPPTNAFAH